jgi:hypothetical protein
MSRLDFGTHDTVAGTNSENILSTRLIVQLIIIDDHPLKPDKGRSLKTYPLVDMINGPNNAELHSHSARLGESIRGSQDNRFLKLHLLRFFSTILCTYRNNSNSFHSSGKLPK